MNQLDISRTLNVEKSFLFSGSQMIIWLLATAPLLYSPNGAYERNFYFPKQWSGDSQQRWEVFLPAARTTNCCFKANLKTSHSSRLTLSSKAKAYEESALQEIHNHKKTTGLRTEMTWKSTTIRHCQRSTAKDNKAHGFLRRSTIYKARDICFFEFN